MNQIPDRTRTRCQAGPQCDRQGAMMILIAFVMVLFFIGAAFAIDIAYMHATRAELTTATDAAARAGSEALGRLQDSDAAVQAAIRIAARNQVAGKPLQLGQQDVVLGTHRVRKNGTFEFIEGGTPITSIQVRGSREVGSPSGPVPLFFGPLLGRTNFEPRQVATASRLDRDIAIVLDVSGSMRNFGRFDALKKALLVFLVELKNLPQEEVCSLSVYNSSARRIQPMTTNLGEIRRAFNRERPRGMTAIGRALQAGLDSIEQDPLSRPFAFKEILLMTDGNHNTGINPLNVVSRATESGVVVHTITFGRGANQGLMKRVAERTNGIHLHADDEEELIEVFREIAAQVPVILID